ncbi:hypothetical protein [Allokutzneria oryzae]|uniref:Uncharacterized protein n=1 Tax=Allokutzneria oryzae TaxID=1378989 RepID=A0ABV5ZW19_9PSEU
MTEKLGGVLAIREHWCRPGEPILRCFPMSPWGHVAIDAPDQSHAPDHSQLPEAAPARSLGEKAKRGAVGALVIGALLALPGDGDNNDDDNARASRQSSPALYVVGSSPECQARRILDRLHELRCAGWWVFTPARIGWVIEIGEPKPVEPKPEEPEKESTLGTVANIGKAFLSFAKDIAEIIRDTPPPPKYAPGQAIKTKDVEGHLEIRPEDIHQVQTISRKLSRDYSDRKPTYVRIVFHDGSALDFNTKFGVDADMLIASPRT